MSINEGFFFFQRRVTLSITKNGRGTEQMPEMKKACQKYKSGKV